MALIPTFKPHPDIAPRKSVYMADLADYMLAEPDDTELEGFKWRTYYARDYIGLFKTIKAQPKADREKYTLSLIRALCLKDLFFIVHFIMDVPPANHPFVVQVCNELEESTSDGGLSHTGCFHNYAREHYKACRLSERVMTPTGWRNHGDLQVGDFVFGPDGLPTEVVGRTKVFYDADCYRVNFNDGSSIVCSGDHLWQVWKKSYKTKKGRYNKKGNGREYRSVQVLDTRYLSLLPHGPDNRFSIPAADPLWFPKANLPIHPYILGAWLGDGTSASSHLTCAYADIELIDHIRYYDMEVEHLEKSSAKNCGRFRIGRAGARGRGEISHELRKMNVLNNKHIPRVYMMGSIEQRQELLQGLMDTDGHCSIRGTATFSNHNVVLAVGVQELAVSLGLNPRIRTVNTKYKGEPYVFWQVSFQAYKEFPVFKLSRKLARCKTGMRRGMRFITGVTPVLSEPVSCIQVNREDGLYLVGDNLITTHNSTVVTIGLTIKRLLNDPECTTVFFSYKKPAAEKFVSSIRETLEKGVLIKCFPDILYQKPTTEAVSWSLQNGIRVKRQSGSRRENTCEASGLVEGQPTGGHFDHRIYDDVETFDIAKSPDQMDLCFAAFEMSDNLGTDDGTEIVVGTYYSHIGPLIRIRDKQDIDGNPMYRTIIKPATHDGTRTGRPVLLTQTRLNKLMTSKHFDAQQLCNPVPVAELRLDSSMLQTIEPDKLPANRYKFLIIDQAGGSDTRMTKNRKGDSWAIGLVSVKPVLDDLGASECYLEAFTAGEMTHAEAIDTIIRMYLDGGFIRAVAVEKVGLSTTEIHIRDALKVRGRKISEETKTLILLRPGGRSTTERVEAALQWPLVNSKLFVSTEISDEARLALKTEMDLFPYYHPDIINMWAYAYDIIKTYRFTGSGEKKRVSVTQMMAATRIGGII